MPLNAPVKRKCWSSSDAQQMLRNLGLTTSHVSQQQRIQWKLFHLKLEVMFSMFIFFLLSQFKCDNKKQVISWVESFSGILEVSFTLCQSLSICDMLSFSREKNFSCFSSYEQQKTTINATIFFGSRQHATDALDRDSVLNDPGYYFSEKWKGNKGH